MGKPEPIQKRSTHGWWPFPPGPAKLLSEGPGFGAHRSGTRVETSTDTRSPSPT